MGTAGLAVAAARVSAETTAGAMKAGTTELSVDLSLSVMERELLAAPAAGASMLLSGVSWWLSPSSAACCALAASSASRRSSSDGSGGSSVGDTDSGCK